MVVSFEMDTSFDTPIWRIRNLLSPDLILSLLNLLTSSDSSIYKSAGIGNKLSLEHKTPSGLPLFNLNPVQQLASILLEPLFLRKISECLKHSDSFFFLIHDSTRLLPFYSPRSVQNFSKSNSLHLAPWYTDISQLSSIIYIVTSILIHLPIIAFLLCHGCNSPSCIRDLYTSPY